MPNWITTNSGLMYYDFRFSDGSIVNVGDLLEIHYRIALELSHIENGPWIENTWELRQPIKIRLGNGDLIKGLEEGIVGMKIAGERRLIIPANLSFGDRGVPNRIKPFSQLIYDIYVVDILSP